MSSLTPCDNCLGGRVEVDIASLAGVAFLEHKLVALHIIKCQNEQIADAERGVNAESPDVSIQSVTTCVFRQLTADRFGFTLQF